MVQLTLRKPTWFTVLTLIGLLALALVTACADPVEPDPTPTRELPSPTPAPSSTPSPIPTWTPTPTPVPPKELTICQIEEPNTLFVYGGPSRAARSVLDAIYDGPIDQRDYDFAPVILERLPTLEQRDAALRTVFVTEGERVVDADGEVVKLLPEVALLDADGREVVFEGDIVTMTQMVVTFTLRADVAWADGEPLTAQDSRFSYELAGELDDAALQRRLDRTAEYEAQNETTVVWTGVPGYRDTHYLLNFYHPLPEHLLGGRSVEQLLTAEVVQRRPLGWGPFAVESWVEGERINLVRNPHYFRAAEGLPHLDRVVFRFVGDPEQAVQAVAAGECDVLSEGLSASLSEASLQALSGTDAARAVSVPSSEWEHLDFGIRPAAWSGRVSFFDQAQVRQAVAHCVDRESVASAAFPHAAAVVADSYVPPEHPLHAGEGLRQWAYDPLAGRAMLQEAGWRDENGDGLREAHGVPGVAGGTVFSVTLLTTEGDAARRRAAEILEHNLDACGVGMTTRYLAPDVFWADGPEGPVGGRQFDLALFSWLNGLEPPCRLYLSTEIPGPDNWWGTRSAWGATNNPGYASEAYDEACRSALRALYGTAAYRESHRQAQRIFSQDLPVLPLYFVPRLVVVGADVRGLKLDPSQETPFQEIETIDVER